MNQNARRAHSITAASAFRPTPQHSLNLRIPKLSAYMESFTVWCTQMKWVPISERDMLSQVALFGIRARCESQQQKPVLPCEEDEREICARQYWRSALISTLRTKWGKCAEWAHHGFISLLFAFIVGSESVMKTRPSHRCGFSLLRCLISQNICSGFSSWIPQHLAWLFQKQEYVNKWCLPNQSTVKYQWGFQVLASVFYDGWWKVIQIQMIAIKWISYKAEIQIRFYIILTPAELR